MNLDIPALRNRFYGFRHGESQANVEGIIVSDPSIGTVRYGLSDSGRLQVAENAERLDVTSDAVVISSDFLRTRQTAEIICAALGCAAVRFDRRLRERFFGKWEGQCYLHYSDTWQQDEVDPDQEEGGSESANAVRRRMVDAVLDLDQEFSGRDIILVSHGDPLRMLQTAFEGLDTAQNGTVPYFDTGNWRLLNSCRNG